jgi:hypothetical protein
MNTAVFWVLILVIGLIVAVLGLGLSLRAGPWRMAAAADLAEDTPDLPMTPLQKRAWWSLGIGLAVSTVIVLVMVTKGPTTSFVEDRGLRLLTTALFLAGMASYLIILIPTRLRGSRADVFMDERDRRILARAPVVQLFTAFVALSIWAVVLTEVYWDRQVVPIVFPHLILWSTFLLSLLGSSAGILLGYAGWGDHAEG